MQIWPPAPRTHVCFACLCPSLGGSLCGVCEPVYTHEYALCVGLWWAGRSSTEQVRTCRFPGVSFQLGLSQSETLGSAPSVLGASPDTEPVSQATLAGAGDPERAGFSMRRPGARRGVGTHSMHQHGMHPNWSLSMDLRRHRPDTAAPAPGHTLSTWLLQG